MSNSNSGSIRARTEAERRRAFFYAETQAPYYDVAADLNTPLFSLFQKTIFELVTLHLGRLGEAATASPFVFLDIGSGTGAESLPILEAYPNAHVVAFDLCEQMHGIFREKARAAIGAEAAEKRCRFVTGDIAEPAGSANDLLGHLKEWGLGPRYDMVVTSLALHHLTTEEKRLVTRRVADVLVEKGLYINGDIFSYSSPTMAKNANDFGIEWIRRCFSDPPVELKPMKDALGEQAQAMGDAWIDHYVHYNLPDPVDSLRVADLDDGETHDQAKMLVEAGFTEVAVPFRYWEIGILWAIL